MMASASLRVVLRGFSVAVERRFSLATKYDGIELNETSFVTIMWIVWFLLKCLSSFNETYISDVLLISVKIYIK